MLEHYRRECATDRANSTCFKRSIKLEDIDDLNINEIPRKKVYFMPVEVVSSRVTLDRPVLKSHQRKTKTSSHVNSTTHIRYTISTSGRMAFSPHPENVRNIFKLSVESERAANPSHEYPINKSEGNNLKTNPKNEGSVAVTKNFTKLSLSHGEASSEKVIKNITTTQATLNCMKGYVYLFSFFSLASFG